jgi:hypothetical protein
MGLFSNWSNLLTPNTQTQGAAQLTPQQLADYNYSIAQSKIERNRKIADLLTKESVTPQQQGQFIKNGDFIGYAGGPTIASALLQGLQGLGGSYLNKQANDQAQQASQDNLNSIRTKMGIASGALSADGTDPQTVGNQAVLDKAVQLDQSPSQVGFSPNAVGLKSDPSAVQPDLNVPDAPQLPDVSNIPAAPEPVQADPMVPLGSPVNRPGQPIQSKAAAALAKIAALDPKGAAAQAVTAFSPSPIGAATAPATTPMPSTAASQFGPNAQGQLPTSDQVRGAYPNDPNMAPMVVPDAQGVLAPQAQVQAQVAANQARANDTTQQMLNMASLSNNGPVGEAIQQQMIGKNGRYTTQIQSDRVNGGFIQVVTDSRTGQVVGVHPYSPVGNERVLETKEGANGTILERTASGWREAKVTGTGAPVVTASGQDSQQKQIEAKTQAYSSIGDMKTRLGLMTQVIPLIKSVGTGRLQTPWNEVSSYFSNSDDYDKMNNVFNQQQLQGAVDWLKGQGSVSDSERKLLAGAQFNPKGSTQSNIDYANTIVAMLQKHIPLAESSYAQKYGGDAPVGIQQPTTKPNAPYRPWEKN